jgi:hypothetical protein
VQQFYTKFLEASRTLGTQRAPQEIRPRFPGDPWIHLSNGYFEIDLYFNYRNDVLFNIRVTSFNWRCVYFVILLECLRNVL